MKTLVVSLRFLLVFTLVLGLGYPLVVTAIAQLAFPAQANGSLFSDGGQVRGSTLIGQDFSGSPGYFQGRPSATGDHAYNPMSSGGSNLTVVGQAFQDRVSAAVKVWRDRQKALGLTGVIPEALVTASGSGLDPHLDLNAVVFQVPFVAAARPGSDPAQIEALARSLAVKPLFPWDPAPFVNVVDLNRALDKAFPPGH